MRRLPARAHDNGIFVVFGNGVGGRQWRGADRQRHDHRPVRADSPRDMGRPRQDDRCRPRLGLVAVGHRAEMDPGAAAGTVRDSHPATVLHCLSARGAILRPSGQAYSKVVNSGLNGICGCGVSALPPNAEVDAALNHVRDAPTTDIAARRGLLLSAGRASRKSFVGRPPYRPTRARTSARMKRSTTNMNAIDGISRISAVMEAIW
jgi:hypothetical protein